MTSVTLRRLWSRIASPAPASVSGQNAGMIVEPFRIDVDGEVLIDLRRRILATRWPAAAPGPAWAQGTDLAYLKMLLAHWSSDFDWRAEERRLNEFDQFRATVDGVAIHFVHERAVDGSSIPLILLHGLLYDRINQAVLVSVRDRTRFALLAIDLDGFKAVNDELGHAGGDVVLQHISARLVEAMRASDTVARWGGDEFTILLAGAARESASALAQRLRHLVEVPVEVDGRPAVVGATVGVAAYPEDGADLQALLNAADRAMYRGKRQRGERAIQDRAPA